MSSFDWGTGRTSDSAGSGSGRPGGSGSQQSGGSVPHPAGSAPGGPPNRRGLVVGVLTALFVVALGWFVVRPMLTGTTDAAAAAPAAHAAAAGTSAATATPALTATPSSSATATASATTSTGTGTPRNPFVPLLTPSVSSSLRPTSEPPAQPSGSTEPSPTPSPSPTRTPPIGLGRATSPAASPTPNRSDAAEGALSPHGTLTLTAISARGRSASAQMTWNGRTYRAQPGEQFTKYLTLVDVSGKQARFSYRDQPFTLRLHQKRTF